MRNNPTSFIFLAFALVLLFSACDGGGANSEKNAPTPEEMLIGSWKLKSLNMGGQPAPPDIMVNSSFNFYKDGRYEILMGDLDRGTWSLSADKRVLITVPDNSGGMQNMIDLEKITPDQVVLYNSRPNPVRMTLMPG